MSDIAPTRHDLSIGCILGEQLEHHWNGQIRPRLEGLTDDEYLWDPTTDHDVWTVRPRTDEVPEGRIVGGSGATVIDFAFPEPDPAPFTTIAWRLGHVIVGVLALRSHHHFDGPAADYMTWDYAATASEALDQLDTEHDRWIAGVKGWSDDDLAQPVGPAEGPYAELTRADLVAHIHRELIHHLAEVALLRDLYAHMR